METLNEGKSRAGLQRFVGVRNLPGAIGFDTLLLKDMVLAFQVEKRAGAHGDDDLLFDRSGHDNKKKTGPSGDFTCRPRM